MCLRDCGQGFRDEPAFSCHREIRVEGTVELCPDNLLRTSTPAAPDNRC